MTMSLREQIARRLHEKIGLNYRVNRETQRVDRIPFEESEYQEVYYQYADTALDVIREYRENDGEPTDAEIGIIARDVLDCPDHEGCADCDEIIRPALRKVFADRNARRLE